MNSPTGYVARFTVRERGEGGRAGDLVVDDEPRPILHWNTDGRPVIANEEGALVTAEQHLAFLRNPGDEDIDTYVGYFEVQPARPGE